MALTEREPCPILDPLVWPIPELGTLQSIAITQTVERTLLMRLADLPLFAAISSFLTGNRLIKGAMWSLAGAAIARGFQLLSTVLVARLLGRVGYGKLGFIQNTVTMFGILAGFGIGLTATKYVAEYRRSQPVRAGRILAISSLIAVLAGGIGSALLYLFSDWIAKRTVGDISLGPLLRSSAWLILLSALNGAQIGALSGFEAFKAIARVNTVAGILSCPIVVLFTLRGGLPGAVYGLVAGLVLNCGLTQVEVLGECRRWGVRLWEKDWLLESHVLLKFSVPAVVGGLLTAPVIWLGSTLVAQRPNGYAEMGAFNAANTFRLAVMFIPLIVVQASFPALSAAYGEISGNRQEFRRLLALTHNTVSVVAAFCGVAGMFLAPYLVMLFGADYRNTAVVLLGLMISVTIQSLGCAVGAAIQAKGDMWFGTSLNLVWGIAFLGFVGLTAARLGAGSLAFGNAFAYLLLVGLQVWKMHPELPEGMSVRIGSSLLLLIAIAPVAFLLINGHRLFPAILLSLALGTAAAYYSRVPVHGWAAAGLQD